MFLAAFAGLFLHGYTLRVDSIGPVLEFQYTSEFTISWHQGKRFFRSRARFYGTRPFTTDELETAGANRSAVLRRSKRRGCGLISTWEFFCYRMIFADIEKKPVPFSVLGRDPDGTLVIDYMQDKALSISMLEQGEAKLDPAILGRDGIYQSVAEKARSQHLGYWAYVPEPPTPPRR